jgi:hypothetical protein
MTRMKKCFVIMPFSETETCSEEEWETRYEYLFKKTIEEAGYECECSSPVKGGSIIKNIIQQLYIADIVLADLTNLNANVFYELGVRHALRKRTIMIAQENQKLPFDISGYGVIFYSTDLQGGEDFKNKILERIKEIERNPEKSDNPVCDFLSEEIDKYTRQLETPYERINYELISNFIEEAHEIWVMNPLSDLSTIENAIIGSIKKGCRRKYIIQNAELDLYKTYIKKLQDKTKIDVNALFNLIPIDPRFMFPLSFVICDPLEANRARAWVQPKKGATKKDLYALYTNNEIIVSQFVGTFLAISNLLKQREA